MSNVMLEESEQEVRVHVPMKFRNRSGRKEIVVPDGLEQSDDASPDYHEALVIALSRAHRWKKMLDEGKYGSIAELAQVVKINRHYLARLLRLTLLAPDIIEAILDGREPDGMSLEQLRRPMSMVWEKQVISMMFSRQTEEIIVGSTNHIEARGNQARK